MRITAQVYDQMVQSFSQTVSSKAGILGIADGTVCAYMREEVLPAAVRTASDTDADELPGDLSQWSRRGIAFAGLVHGHPAGQDCLSKGDLQSMETLFAELPEDIKCLFFPLVMPDGVVCFQIRRLGEKLLIEKKPIDII